MQDQLRLDIEPAQESTRVVPINEIEQVVIDGDQVTITSDNGRRTTMTKQEFQDLRGGHAMALPVDRKIQIDIGQEGEQTFTIEGEQPVLMTKYPRGQKLGQAVVNFVEAAAAAYLVNQVIPYGGNGFYTFTSNAMILSTLREWFSKERPGINYYTSAGNGSFLKGLFKLGVINLTAYTLVFAGNMISINIEPQDSSLIQSLNNIMSHPACQLPILGTAGYLTNQFARWAGRKSFEYCLPSYEEMVKVNPDLNLLQLLCQYGLRWLNDVAMTEMLLYYVAIASPTLAAHEKFQIAMLMASDVMLQMGEYFSYVPYPVKAMYGEPVIARRDIEQGGVRQADDGGAKCETVCSKSVNKATVFAAMFLGAFLINEFTALIIETHNPGNPEKVNTFPNRTLRFGISLGIPFAIKYAADNVVPKLSTCCSTLFGRRSGERQTLLAAAPAPSYGASQHK
jgi:hypothetical protein